MRIDLFLWDFDQIIYCQDFLTLSLIVFHKKKPNIQFVSF